MSRITIPTEVWVELYSELASWHVENSIDNPWAAFEKEGDEAVFTYNEEAQDKFNAASSVIEEILENFFVKGSWSEREDI